MHNKLGAALLQIISLVSSMSFLKERMHVRICVRALRHLVVGLESAWSGELRTFESQA